MVQRTVNLWLDDERPPPEKDGWYWAKGAYEAIGWLVVNWRDCAAISLDHDLGTDPIDGFTVLDYLDEHHYMYEWDYIKVHSMNGAERGRMQKVIDKHRGV